MGMRTYYLQVEVDERVQIKGDSRFERGHVRAGCAEQAGTSKAGSCFAEHVRIRMYMCRACNKKMARHGWWHWAKFGDGGTSVEGPHKAWLLATPHAAVQRSRQATGRGLIGKGSGHEQAQRG